MLSPVEETKYGPVQVRMTLQSRRIIDVTATQLPSDLARSVELSNDAAPILHDEVLQAQSAKIDGVSGATYTSQGTSSRFRRRSTAPTPAAPDIPGRSPQPTGHRIERPTRQPQLQPTTNPAVSSLTRPFRDVWPCLPASSSSMLAIETEWRCEPMRSTRLKSRDLIATILVAGLVVPYIGYLISGEMPYTKDLRGLTGAGLVLGVIAFLVLRTGDAFNRTRKFEVGLATVVLALGIVALILAETAAAEVLLAIFMGSILVMWVVELMDHSGFLHGAGHST